jgi:hypothetical protein
LNFLEKVYNIDLNIYLFNKISKIKIMGAFRLVFAKIQWVGAGGRGKIF